jgi:hypothetical protein
MEHFYVTPNLASRSEKGAANFSRPANKEKTPGARALNLLGKTVKPPAPSGAPRFAYTSRDSHTNPPTMLNARISVLPDSDHAGSPAASFEFRAVPAYRSPLVGGAHGCGQPLRGTWRPMLLQPAAQASPRTAPFEIVRANGKTPQVSLGWWRSFLQRIGIVAVAGPAAGIQPPEAICAAVEIEAEPDQVLHHIDEDDGDAAAAFWEEHLIAPGENLQVYAPAEYAPAASEDSAPQWERPRIGRSFLGAYRKGRRAAEAGSTTKHCPYRARLEKEGRPVNALTRTFQRYWAEGLNDVLSGQPERYV